MHRCIKEEKQERRVISSLFGHQTKSTLGSEESGIFLVKYKDDVAVGFFEILLLSIMSRGSIGLPSANISLNIFTFYPWGTV